jgi:uncharacterized membrane protein HdeD (DUF308 family)
MAAFFTLLAITLVVGFFSQLVGLIYFFSAIKNKNEANKEIALKYLVFGTVLILVTGLVCGIGISV